MTQTAPTYPDTCKHCDEPSLFVAFMIATPQVPEGSEPRGEMLVPHEAFCLQHLNFDFKKLSEEVDLKKLCDGQPIAKIEFGYSVLGSNESFRANISGQMLCDHCDEPGTHMPMLIVPSARDAESSFGVRTLVIACAAHRKHDFRPTLERLREPESDQYQDMMQQIGAPDLERVQFAYTNLVTLTEDFFCNELSAPLG